MKILEEAKKETLEKVCLKSLSRQKEVTAKVFHKAYKVAKSNQSFNNSEMDIELQELNGGMNTSLYKCLH
jgi:ribosomal protein L19E